MENGEEVIRCLNEEERIYVSVRIRPLNSKEISRNDVSDWDCINDKTIVFKNVGILASERSIYPTAYTFDRVFRSDCSTREVYEQGAKDVAISVVSGINSTVFAYGQTSSGKTYTMTGITQYAIADIYDYMHKRPERDFILKFSAMEIYNESVRDLLSDDGTQLRLLDDPERGTIVEKLSEEIVRDWDHVIQLLSICEAQRQIGETSLNETSSRSHQIIRLTIESSSREFVGRDNASMLTATVNFVDLAGSERLSAGTRLKEGCHINRSLLTLGTVIRKLSKGRNGHIPYRDSKLTRILQTSLGGNARTAIICTMSPARTHVEQSRNTLLFATCAKQVTTSAHVNVVMSDKALIKHLQKELARHQTNPPNYSALLREKDVQIQKLENEVKDLILQRDVALSQVNDLLQMLGDESSTSTLQAGLEEYPHLRVQNSPDAEIHLQEETSKLADPPRTCSDYDHLLEENFVNINATPRILVSSSSSSSRSMYSYQGWTNTHIDKRLSEEEEEEDELDALTRCIDPPQSSNTQDDDELDGLQEVIVMEEKQSISPTFKMDSEEEKELLLTSHDISKTEKESRSVDYFHIKKLSSTDKDQFGNRNSRLVKSKSCNASITADSTWPSIGSEKDEGIGRGEIYVGSSVERLSSKDIIIESPPVKKNVGLDRIIEDNEMRGLSSWPVEFKRLQKEIIQLWDACNIALVHRTYFFLLFQGDPTDAIYLEVEIRRMKFLKDKFYQGDKTSTTILNGKRLTLASSAKALRQERRMLNDQLMKKFSQQERETLFVKWGINLKTKFRRLQLANILWTNTQDMKHIDESAYLVAKLVGFIEPGQTPNKEMFGLNFAPRTTSNSSGISSFKTSLVSIF